MPFLHQRSGLVTDPTFEKMADCGVGTKPTAGSGTDPLLEWVEKPAEKGVSYETPESEQFFLTWYLHCLQLHTLFSFMSVSRTKGNTLMQRRLAAKKSVAFSAATKRHVESWSERSAAEPQLVTIDDGRVFFVHRLWTRYTTTALCCGSGQRGAACCGKMDR